MLIIPRLVGCPFPFFFLPHFYREVMATKMGTAEKPCLTIITSLDLHSLCFHPHFCPRDWLLGELHSEKGANPVTQPMQLFHRKATAILFWKKKNYTKCATIRSGGLLHNLQLIHFCIIHLFSRQLSLHRLHLQDIFGDQTRYNPKHINATSVICLF